MVPVLSSALSAGYGRADRGGGSRNALNKALSVVVEGPMCWELREAFGVTKPGVL